MLAATACGDSGQAPPRFPDSPPVILVIIDTLRADHLGFDGYALPTSPFLDELAAQSHQFSANTTQCNATFASITSILTGLYPKTHRNYTAVAVKGVSSASDDASTLAERLRAQGYYTTAVLSHPSMTQRLTGTALDRGWDSFSTLSGYIPAEERRHVTGKAEQTTERAFKQLDEWAMTDSESPLFIWVHYFDPHTPYDPPKEKRNRFLRQHLAAAGYSVHEEALASLEPRGGARQAYIDGILDDAERQAVRLANGRALYDAEILACDEQIARLFERLREEGLFDEALVIVLADHGENLEDEAWGHGSINFSHQRLFEGVTRTPMLVKLPRQSDGSVSAALTQNIDVLPTVVELLGLAVDPVTEGRSLVPLLDDPKARVHEQVFVESSDHVEKGLRTETLKFVDGLNPEPQVFDWVQDPNETRDIASELPAGTLLGLSEAMRSFRPLNAVGVRAIPDTAPYELIVTVNFDEARTESVVGASARIEPQRVAFTMAVDEEPLEVLLFLDRPMRGSRWTVSHSARRDLPDSIHLGRTPLAETAAVPIWHARDSLGVGGQPVAANDVGDTVTLQQDDTLGHWSLQLGPDVSEDVVVELQFANSAPTALKFLGGVGFNFLGPAPSSRIAHLKGTVETGAESASLGWPPERGPLFAAVKIHDRWPDTRNVIWNGQRVAEDLLEFVLPPDTRITADLLGARDGWIEPEGALILFTTTASQQVELDTSGLAPEAVEELRALGYVK